MADRLAQTYGTELDRENCPFYFKTGACRYGDECSRKHRKPAYSQTVLLSHMYLNPLAFPEAANFSPETIQQSFEEFYEDVFTELEKFGEIEDMQVADNLCEHLFGNVYVKFTDENAATECVAKINGRKFGKKPVVAELSPVTDFRDARGVVEETLPQDVELEGHMEDEAILGVEAVRGRQDPIRGRHHREDTEVTGGGMPLEVPNDPKKELEDVHRRRPHLARRHLHQNMIDRLSHFMFI
ncbi:putative Splicing factor U2AF 23 kDa subunit [Blattamonas nauphoetae]|uniref:Splicing factor U2AF 23 kDa subunit n=1 Tax=Blattamonas nauphoetae TaxID=2049346 RepID=A0ABQ9XAH3_9EUKA|nr:putative Splicing factor U2AF 23 kDa subunit [Blattamonas nauphoetae]